MNDAHDLEIIIRSRIPIIVIETHEEQRVVDLFRSIALRLAKPLFKWTVTQGLRRLDMDYPPQRHNAEPDAVIGQIRATDKAGVYLLLDFHPYLRDPALVRMIREVAQAHDSVAHTLVLIGPEVEIPSEIKKLCARFELSLPDRKRLGELVQDIASKWSRENTGRRVKTDRKTLDLLVRNLTGLTLSDARRLARNAIYDDGAITHTDVTRVMEAKYKLFDTDGVLSFEYDTARFSDVAGLENLKHWLEQRRVAYQSEEAPRGLDKPKGIMLLGVQGCGKSLAARAVAGMWGVPLLRLDFGALYNKYIGETERNLREALKTAGVMSPCVLWIDEIEKGISAADEDAGTSQRILGTLLTWMAEKQTGVFIVATANDISALPPELIRKGRLDEIFFVDLPDRQTRRRVFEVHMRKRDIDTGSLALDKLADASAGFSGSEIEQAVVSALYAAHSAGEPLSTQHLLSEIRLTRPLSVVMAERVRHLQDWAKGRTVPAG